MVIAAIGGFMGGQTGVELSVFWSLIGCSVVEVAVVIERLWTYRKLAAATVQFKTALKPVLEGGQDAEILAACRQSAAPLATILADMWESAHVKLRPEQSLMLMRHSMERARARLTRFLTFLATLAGTAPFIGLFGTVLGIMHTFSSIAKQGFGGPAVVSAGISAALIATAAGLAVAIPAVIFYNVFLRNVNAVLKEAEAEATQILIMTGRL